MPLHPTGPELLPRNCRLLTVSCIIWRLEWADMLILLKKIRSRIFFLAVSLLFGSQGLMTVDMAK